MYAIILLDAGRETTVKAEIELRDSEKSRAQINLVMVSVYMMKRGGESKSVVVIVHCGNEIR